MLRAVLVEDGVLVRHLGRRAVAVPEVRVLRDEAQQDALAAARDQQREVAAHRRRVESWSRRSRIRGSAARERLDAVARAAERVAVLGVVGLEPARADAEHEAPAAHVVDRARHVGVQIGVAIGVARHERAQARALVAAGERREQRHALEVRARRHPRARRSGRSDPTSRASRRRRPRRPGRPAARRRRSGRREGSRRRCAGDAARLDRSPDRAGSPSAAVRARAGAGAMLGGEALEEAELVVRRAVEDEVAEAELEVGRDALDRLVGVARADEARGGLLVVELVGQARELARIVDALLGLGRQRERRPEAAVRDRRRAVGRVGELDLDHALDRRRDRRRPPPRPPRRSAAAARRRARAACPTS